MERLTVPDEKVDGGLLKVIIDAREVRKHAMTLYWALKKYEDTGLTPEEVTELKEKATPKKPDFEGDGYAEDELVYDTWLCPSCGEDYEVEYDEHDYCPKCGQAIKWGE